MDKKVSRKKEWIHVLICENESVSLKINELYMKEISKCTKIPVKIYCCNSNFSDPLQLASEQRMDIALMDICLDNKNGLIIASELMKYNKNMLIIYITNYTEYSMDAYRMKAFGYLEKPVVLEELLEYFKKAVIYLQGIKNQNLNRVLHFTSNREKISLYQKNIIYVERVQRKVDIVTYDKVFCAYISIANLEKLLSSDFVKINQGTIINKKEILFRDHQTVTMCNGEVLGIGRIHQKKMFL